ncbi:hypothetical protein HRbin40_01933 [bacterium HR40]|nr:hypothetical protein HRbin40_01933 [bacterium HR40]
MEEVHAALARIPLFAGVDRAQIRATRLGGLTNRVWRLDFGGRSFCLRIPGHGTADYIDRRAEETNARAAARAGVSPEVLYFDPTDGLMLTPFLAGAVTMSPDLFRRRPGAAARAGAVLRRLHTSGERFANRFDLFAMIDGYLAALARRNAALPEGYREAMRQAEVVREALAAHPVPWVPCHCDPLCENFLDDGSRMWIVDWEYAGMNDPMWDLGDLAVEGAFSEALQGELLVGYFGQPPDPFDRGRMAIFMAMCDLLWTLWGLIQDADGNPADDFKTYAANRFARYRQRVARADFAEHLEAVRAGPHGGRP